MNTTLRRLAAANPVPAERLEDLVALLPGPPLVDEQRTTRLPARRRAVFAALLVLAVGVATPALALRNQLTESIQQFFSSDAPEPAKTRIAAVVASATHGMGAVDQVGLALTAEGPQGEIQLYQLHFANGDVGSTIINTGSDPATAVVGATKGSPRPLAEGLALDVRLSSVAYPGRSPVYFDGVVASRVAGVEVVYPDGHSEPIAAGNGFMLGWITPQPDRNYGDGEVVAKDANGMQIGRLDFCQTNQTGSDVEIRVHTAGMPSDPTAACAVPPTPDHG